MSALSRGGTVSGLAGTRLAPVTGASMHSAKLGPGDGPLVFISASEPSADLHAASLIRAVRTIRPEIRFAGVAGPAMQAEGCWPIFDMTRHAAMLLGVARVVRPALKLLATTKRHLRQYPFSAAVVIDSPTLNLPIAKLAKRRGLPVLYFIAPQLWAWGRFRVRRVRARVDRMAVILPFEEAFFRSYGIEATYVGHPLFDKLSAHPADQHRVEAIKRAGKPVIAILPGSRQHVVKEVLHGQLKVAARILDEFPEAHLGISVANRVVRPTVRDRLASSGLSATLYEDGHTDLLAAADLTLVASGTATLEVAYRRSPMIVMYNASKWGYHLLARWLIRTPQLSLVNILAGRELVPEFMPYYASTEPIAERAIEMLRQPETLERMSTDLANLLDPLIKTGASDNTARLLLEMIDDRG